MSDIATEQRSAAAIFMDEHDRIKDELETAKATILQQASNIIANEQMIAMQKEHIVALNADKNRYLRYSVELSAQLQFIVSGAARALKVAHGVQASLNEESDASIPSADQTELEDILGRLSINDLCDASVSKYCSPATQMMKR